MKLTEKQFDLIVFISVQLKFQCERIRGDKMGLSRLEDDSYLAFTGIEKESELLADLIKELNIS